MDVWMDGWVNVQMNGSIDGCTDLWMGLGLESLTFGWIDG
jgi:hypothetical protein